jgi:hypothetical protein
MVLCRDDKFADGVACAQEAAFHYYTASGVLPGPIELCAEHAHARRGWCGAIVWLTGGDQQFTAKLLGYFATKPDQRMDIIGALRALDVRQLDDLEGRSRDPANCARLRDLLAKLTCLPIFS